MTCRYCEGQSWTPVCAGCQSMLLEMFAPEPAEPTPPCRFCGGPVNRQLHASLGFICGCGSSWRPANGAVKTLDEVISSTIGRLEKVADLNPVVPPPRPERVERPERPMQPPLFFQLIPGDECPDCTPRRKCWACVQRLAREDQRRLEELRKERSA